MRIESMLRRIVEEPFAWVSGDQIDPYGLAGHLLRQISEDKVEEPGNVQSIVVRVNPAQLPEDEAAVAVLEQAVLNYLELLAVRTGQPLEVRPGLRLVGDSSVGNRGAVVDLVDTAPQAGPPSTALFARSERNDIGLAIQAADAFLIVQGRQHVPLQRPVIRLGRRVDNDIVLESSAVSRYHAQLQWRDDGYVLFDTSSHGRTWINGVPVQEQRLESGDVIGLSDVLLVYGEGRDSAEPITSDTSHPSSDTLLGP